MIPTTLLLRSLVLLWAAHFYYLFDTHVLRDVATAEDAEYSQLHHHSSPPSSRHANCSSSLDALGMRQSPPWVCQFLGSEFEAYRSRIDKRIDEETKLFGKGLETCDMPFYDGEYGYEIAAMVPWAYHKSRATPCNVVTEGVVGTKYVYFFSHKHTIRNATDDGLTLKRQARPLPKGAPLRQRSGSPHTNDAHFPQNKWLAPPYKEFFARDDIEIDKPVVVIFNKYTREGKPEGDPINFIPINSLRQVLQYLTPRYSVVYVRLESKKLDDHQQTMTFGDKDMIRAEFPVVVLMDNLVQDLDPDEINLLLFSLASLSDRFISVQGGNSVIASYFGGSNIIMAKKGGELKHGDYTYYYRFSGARTEVAKDEVDLLERIKKRM